jgi:putative FmdB family regulatory protein
MPTYEYVCQTCNIYKDIVRGYHDEEIVPTCTTCTDIMKRSYGKVGIQFKGTGFYKTDNPK